MNLSVAKQISISLGLYRPARFLHRFFSKTAAAQFTALRSLYSQFIGPGDLAFDVGANIGSRTEVMLSLGATVVAFEPQPSCAKELRARQNGKLIVVEAAVGSADGEATLHVKADKTHSSLVTKQSSAPDASVLRVPVTTLDLAIKEYGRPRFCKIDVEGFETEVLKGLTSNIQTLCFEYCCDDHGMTELWGCLDLLSRRGDFEMNLIGEEGAVWFFSKWLSKKEFKRSFSREKAPFYGDIYIKFSHL
jgi:FkbM family methyltransferase